MRLILNNFWCIYAGTWGVSTGCWTGSININIFEWIPEYEYWMIYSYADCWPNTNIKCICCLQPDQICISNIFGHFMDKSWDSNKPWTSLEHVANKSRACHEQGNTELWTSHEQILIRLWTNYKWAMKKNGLFLNKFCKSHELLTNYEEVMRK